MFANNVFALTYTQRSKPVIPRQPGTRTVVPDTIQPLPAHCKIPYLYKAQAGQRVRTVTTNSSSWVSCGHPRNVETKRTLLSYDKTTTNHPATYKYTVAESRHSSYISQPADGQDRTRKRPVKKGDGNGCKARHTFLPVPRRHCSALCLQRLLLDDVLVTLRAKSSSVFTFFFFQLFPSSILPLQNGSES